MWYTIFMIIILSLWFLLLWRKLCMLARDYIKPNIIEWLKYFIDWRFGVCYLLVWGVIHIPLYLGIVIGPIIKWYWLSGICTTIYGLLWLPFCNENILILPIAAALKKIIFRKHSLDSKNK